MDNIDGGTCIEHIQSSITDELREYAMGWRDRSCHEHLLAIADRIDERHEHELAHLGSEAAGRYVELPVDADETPIRVGDEMDVGIVFAIGDEGVFMVRSRPGGKHEFDFFDGRACRHAQQDSWERIVEDAMDWDADGWECTRADAVSDLVARCERLAR